MITLGVIQTIVLAITPAVWLIRDISLATVVAVLFLVVSAFHILRSVLFKYPVTTIGSFLDETAQYVLIANCCYQEFRAKAYCLSQVLAGLFRFIVELRWRCHVGSDADSDAVFVEH